MKLEHLEKTLKELELMDKYTDRLNTAFKAFEPSFNFVTFSRYQSLVINTLKIAYDDERDWISYFIYDCEYGKKDMEVTINKKTFKLKTVNQLYQILSKTL